MAKRYVLGPNAARKVAELIRGSGEVSRRQGATSALAFDSEYVAPYTVQWAQSALNGEGEWIIWLPLDKDMLLVDGKQVDVTANLAAVGEPYPEGWFVLRDVVDASSGGNIFLNVHIPNGEGSAEDGGEAMPASSDGEDDASEIEVKFAPKADEAQSGEDVVAVLIAKTKGKGVVQNVTSAIILSSGGTCEADEKSIDLDGEKRDDDGQKKSGDILQIASFNSDDRDSGKGIAKRLKADPETGVITGQDSDGLMLLARKNGRIVYVPIDGDGEDPEDPQEPGEGAPKECDHDNSGSAGGVSPVDDGGGGNKDAGVAAGVGGVAAAGGEKHKGDDNCNCE